jgi:hypothetical protein
MMWIVPVIIAAGGLALAAPAAAQAPVAGSGALPALDPLAKSAKIVIDAVAKVMSDRADKKPFLSIKACFRASRVQIALRRSCRFRLERYERRVRQKYPDLFRGLPPLEVYIRLVELSDDPDQLNVRKDLFALRGCPSSYKLEQSAA